MIKCDLSYIVRAVFINGVPCNPQDRSSSQGVVLLEYSYMPIQTLLVGLPLRFITSSIIKHNHLITLQMVPVLALLLSISQACMIQVSLADQVHHVRFILGKVISPLLEYNPNGRVPIEQAFNCQFRDDVQLKAFISSLLKSRE